MNKRRILLIINSGLINSGVPKVVIDIVSGLYSKYTFDIVVQSKQKGYYDEILRQMGCRIFYRSKIPSGRIGILYRLTLWPIKLFCVILNGSYDCVHSFTAYQSGIDCLVAKLCGVKIRVSNTHGTVARNHSFLTGLYQKISLFCIRKFATHRIGVSTLSAKSIYNGMNYKVIYNSIPVDEYKQISHIEHDGLNFLQIGYFNENKNQLFSISLLKELLEESIKCHLFLIGFDDGNGYLNLILDYIKANDLSESVTFLPHDYKKDKIFPIIDFMLQPSYREGLSLVALECQAAGIKCLVSEAIPDEVNIGLLHRLPLTAQMEWIKSIRQLRNIEESINEEKVETFSRTSFLNDFMLIYDYKY